LRYQPALPATPDEIERVALDIILAKGRRTQRALHSYHRLLMLNERKLIPVVNEWLEWTNKQLQAGLAHMRGKSAEAKAKSIADWEAIQAHGDELLKPPLFEVLEAGGNSVMEQRRLIKQDMSFEPFEIRRTWEITKQDRFDPIGIEAVKWTTEHSAALVVEITNETMLAIREYIEAGINAGKSIQKIAMELRPLVGLTSKDIMAVANYHEMLIVSRPEYSPATQRQMADTYARRLHRRRATTIARTETATSLTEGQRQGYGQMGIKKIMIVEAPTCCDICADFDGHVYTIGRASGMLPQHPNCRGTWVAA